MHSVRSGLGRASQNGNSSLKEEFRDAQKPWLQLAFVLGEAALSLVSSGVLFIIISRVSGPELLGTYALAFAWLTLFQGVSSFGIPEFLMREVGGSRPGCHRTSGSCDVAGTGKRVRGPLSDAGRGPAAGVLDIPRSGHHHRQPGLDPSFPQYRLPFGVPGPAQDAFDVPGAAGRGHDHDVRQPVPALVGLRRDRPDDHPCRRQGHVGIHRSRFCCTAKCSRCGRRSIPAS